MACTTLYRDSIVDISRSVYRNLNILNTGNIYFLRLSYFILYFNYIIHLFLLVIKALRDFTLFIQVTLIYTNLC